MRKYKLDSIVREYMIENLGATQIDNRYPRLLQIAISGLKNLNKDVRGYIKVERIELDQSNFIASLPNDYLRYRSIYICSAGQQIALALNTNMCTPCYDDCGNMEVDGFNNNEFSGADGFFLPYSPNVPIDPNGNFTGRQYGVGGGNNGVGYYRIFEDQGYIAFQNVNVSFDEIIIEYLADVEQINGETYVHPFDVEALKAWMDWQYNKRSASVSLGQKAEDKRQYGIEKLKARKRHNKFNVHDLMLAYRSAFVSAPKI